MVTEFLRDFCFEITLITFILGALVLGFHVVTKGRSGFCQMVTFITGMVNFVLGFLVVSKAFSIFCQMVRFITLVIDIVVRGPFVA